MTTEQIISELRTLGADSTKRIFLNHGAPAACLGVKVEDLKKIQKKVKKDHALSLSLYSTGIPDAQYLAGLIADEKKISKNDLQHWVENASWYMLSEYTVPWIAAESQYGWELALDWIDDGRASVQSSGWATLASLVSIKENEGLDLKTLKSLLGRVEKRIAGAPNRVRYAMNGFVIATGGYVDALRDEALRVGKAVGKVEVEMGKTACKVPYAPDYIRKMAEKGMKKKKMARC
ncbi:MAG TPA: DNA alkylation repair protein [Flavisolibacter sp.]|nr:DNA alkylation repair protein [Flavisolibacter sp.]